MNWVLFFHDATVNLDIEDVNLQGVVNFNFFYIFVARGTNIDQFVPYFRGSSYKLKLDVIYENYAFIMNEKYQPPSKKDKVIVGAYLTGPWVIDVLRQIKKDNYVVKNVFTFLIDGNCVLVN